MPYANKRAASFPDGNINPYNRSLIDILSPLSKLAVVPPTLSAYLYIIIKLNLIRNNKFCII